MHEARGVTLTVTLDATARQARGDGATFRRPPTRTLGGLNPMHTRKSVKRPPYGERPLEPSVFLTPPFMGFCV